jgi:hypothetical protein
MTRPDAPVELAITFFYYRDLPAAQAFYEEVWASRSPSTRAGPRS